MGASRLGNVIGLLILVTVIAAWKTQREHRVIIWFTTFVLALLPVQIILGGLTVTALLEPVIVTAHLGVAILILLNLTPATVTAWTQAPN